MIIHEDNNFSSAGARYDLPGLETMPEGGYTLYLRIRSAWLNIDITPQNFHRSPVASEALARNFARFGNDAEEQELWAYLDDMAQYFLPDLEKIAPQIPPEGKLTLADLQSIDHYTARLEFWDEVPRPGLITPMEPDEEGFLNDMDQVEPSEINSEFPRFQLSEVEVEYDDPDFVFYMAPQKVFLNGEALYWKKSWNFRESMRGINKYNTIRRASLDHQRISKLYGLVFDEKGVLRGQLYHWISVDQHLTWKVVEQAPPELRQKWADQIHETVSLLHGLDIVWGDVKAENVVIDASKDAIVIDLEGGATIGWVDRDNMDSKDGDLQGLQRLMEYLFNDDCHLRLREKEDDMDLDDDSSDC